ncbi:hypothetical protein HJC23_008350 [Cyclotella cryptica]|uniref:Sulfatase N-terminal domain-containing protein n=1 Tax=Cyclotella cryptica TaxID=29204 RepID=A0ABD3Q520_9STRA
MAETAKEQEHAAAADNDNDGPAPLRTYFTSSTSTRKKRPNILLILTDQERSHKHWPEGWAQSNLPSFYDCLVGCCRQCSHHPTRKSASRSSVMFTRAFTATTECSPSRATLLTSSYPTEHGVDTTPGSLDPSTDYSLEKRTDRINNVHVRPNLLRLLSNPIRYREESSEVRGYDVAWKGKWHLTPPVRSPYNPKNEDPSILMWYGATNLWNPPDAGHSLSRSSTLGGGWKYNHDGRFLRGEEEKFYVLSKQQDVQLEKESRALRGNSNGGGVDPRIVPCGSSDDDSSNDSSVVEDKKESVLDFLAKHAKKSTVQGLDVDGDSTGSSQDNSQPFFLVTSLVNPHDVWASACFAHLTDDEFYRETGYHPREFETLPIDLPPSHKDDLSTKPSIHSILKTHPVFGDLPAGNLADDGGVSGQTKSDERQSSDALQYVRFYAHLHKQVDAEISSLLEALDANDQMDNTIIIRMADHGELALSHGMREKRMNCYEETMGIPLVINYPSGYFDEQACDTKVEGSAASTTRIVSNLVSSIDILPTIAELAGVDVSRFQYRGKSLIPLLCDESNDPDEEFLFTFDEPLAPPSIPGYIRCLRTSSYKYAVYFTEDGSCFEYEMYDLINDPFEMKNLTPPECEPYQTWRECHDKLTSSIFTMGAIPEQFDWYILSGPKSWVRKTFEE